MNYLDIVVLAIGLSMDAFAVAVCKGTAIFGLKLRHCIITGVWFGAAQAIMPLLGYALGSELGNYISKYGAAVSAAVLITIGIGTVRDAFGEEKAISDDLGIKEMLPLAVATSADAMAAGITLSFYNMKLTYAVIIIGAITFTASAIGVKAGNIFGTKFRQKAEIAGGAVLIILGIKVLAEKFAL